MEDLVRIRVADPAERLRVGERALERVPLARERGAELGQRRLERLEAAAVVLAKSGFATHDVNRRSTLRARLGEEQRAVVEVERGQSELARDLRAARQPLESARNHQMDDDEEIVFEREHDSLAEAADRDDFASFEGGRGGLDGAEHERVRQPQFLERMAEHARLEGLDVNRDVGKFRHGAPIIGRVRTFGILAGGWVLGGAIVIGLSAVGPSAVRAAPSANGAASQNGSVLAIPTSGLTATPGPSGLIVPVLGVEPGDLHDNFSQPRSGGRTHNAIDILAPRGTPVLAAVDGTIRKLFFSRAGGISIYEFDGDETHVYFYAHLDHYAAELAEGQFVKQGTVIGYVGTTGNAPPGTPHLHFAIETLTAEKKWWKGTPLNPYPLLATR